MKRILILLIIFTACKGRAQQVNFAGLDSLFNFYRQHDLYFDHLELEKGGKLIYQQSAGFQNLEKKQPIHAETIFLIGSITKTYTATIIMQLVESGKIRLSDKLATYFPTLPNAAKIDIEMLLRHRSGLFNYTDDKNFLTEVVHPITRQELLDRFARADTLFSPDSKFQYCNTGYALLGFIIEDLTNDSFENQLKTRILNKISVKYTYYGRPDDSSHFALSYANHDGNWSLTQPRWHTSWANAAGAIAATVSDVSTFYKALFGGKLVSAESLRHMMDLKDGYGLGLMLVPFHEQVFYGHGGGLENYRSICAYNPTDSIMLTHFSNGAYDDDPNNIGIQTLNAVYSFPVVMPDTSLKHTVVVPPDTLTTYEGTYAATGFPLKISIFVKDSILYGQATGQAPFPLTPQSVSQFHFKPAGINIHFFNRDTKTGFQFEQGNAKFQFMKE